MITLEFTMVHYMILVSLNIWVKFYDDLSFISLYDAVYQRAIRIVQNKYIVCKDILTNEIKRHNFVLLCSSVSLLLK